MPASSRAVAVALLLAACLVAAEAAVLTDQVRVELDDTGRLLAGSYRLRPRHRRRCCRPDSR